MNNHDSKFSTGFLIGIIIGGGLVFLLGTKTGKNLLKVISEQGLDGFINLLEEYDLDDLIEVEEDEGISEETGSNPSSNGLAKEKESPKTKEVYEELPSQSPKKRFFKRIRR